MRFLIAILFLLVAAPALAQQSQGMSKAMVVSSCGGGAASSGSLNNLTMNPQGQLCLTGLGGGQISAWSTVDAALSNITLTNSGLTATPNAAGWVSVRTTSSKSTGKLYVELKNSVSVAGGNSIALGIADAGFTANNYLGSFPNSAGLFQNGTSLGTSGLTINYNISSTITLNDVWAMAMDLDAGKFWLARNNTWQGGGSPSTGASPMVTITAPALGLSFSPTISFNSDATAGSWTLQSIAATQTYAPPSGFKAWDAP